MSGSSDVPISILSWPQPECSCAPDLCVCGAKNDPHARLRDEVSTHFRNHYRGVYRYLERAGCSRTEAEDVAQETFLRLYRARVNGIAIENALWWVLAVARRIAVDHFRKQQNERKLFEALQPNVAETLPDPGPTYDDNIQERQRRAAFIRSLQNLTSLERECLHLWAQALPLKAIGEIVGHSRWTVRRVLDRSIEQLQRDLDVRP